MTKEYTYQDLELFFAQFKGMPEYITLEQVTRFTQQPTLSSAFPLKGSSFKLWSIMITVASVITISTVLFFSLPGSKNPNTEQSPVQKEVLPPAAAMPVTLADTSESVSLEIPKPAPIVQTNPDKHETVTNELTESEQNSVIKSKKKSEQNLTDEPIDENLNMNDSIGPTSLEKNITEDLSQEELIQGEIGNSKNQSNAYFLYNEVENNEEVFDSEVFRDKKNIFIYQRRKYLLDFCNIANESFDTISKWEIDLTCCGVHNYYRSKDDNAIKTLVYFSLKSITNEQLSKGTYMFTKDHLTTRKEMTFYGSIKIGSDELDISGGEIEVDYFEEEIIVKFNLIVDKEKTISGNYYGIYKTSIMDRN